MTFSPGTGATFTSSVTVPVGTGVSEIVAVSTAPASIDSIFAAMLAAPGDQASTSIPFSVDSPWFWTCDFDDEFFFGGDDRFAAVDQFGAVDAGPDQAEPVDAAGGRCRRCR